MHKIVNENQVYTRVGSPINNTSISRISSLVRVQLIASVDSFALGNLSRSRNYFMIVELHICGSNELLGFAP